MNSWPIFSRNQNFRLFDQSVVILHAKNDFFFVGISTLSVHLMNLDLSSWWANRTIWTRNMNHFVDPYLCLWIRKNDRKLKIIRWFMFRNCQFNKTNFTHLGVWRVECRTLKAFSASVSNHVHRFICPFTCAAYVAGGCTLS